MNQSARKASDHDLPIRLQQNPESANGVIMKDHAFFYENPRSTFRSVMPFPWDDVSFWQSRSEWRVRRPVIFGSTLSRLEWVEFSHLGANPLYRSSPWGPASRSYCDPDRRLIRQTNYLTVLFVIFFCTGKTWSESLHRISHINPMFPGRNIFLISLNECRDFLK